MITIRQVKQLLIYKWNKCRCKATNKKLAHALKSAINAKTVHIRDHAGLLCTMCVWSSTVQGHAFWNELADKVNPGWNS